jgi:hypothetical protein
MCATQSVGIVAQAVDLSVDDASTVSRVMSETISLSDGKERNNE